MLLATIKNNGQLMKQHRTTKDTISASKTLDEEWTKWKGGTITNCYDILLELSLINKPNFEAHIKCCSDTLEITNIGRIKYIRINTKLYKIGRSLILIKTDPSIKQIK